MQSIQVRCPKCEKLYVVDSGEIKTANPKFVCRQCKARFWFQFPLPPGETAPKSFLEDDTASQPKPIAPPKAEPKISQPAASPPQKSEAPPVVAPPPAASEKPAPASPPSTPAEMPAPTKPPEPATNAKAPCPSCGSENPKESTECMACGVIFKKLAPKKEATPAGGGQKVMGGQSLEAAWQGVIDNYDEEKRHESFIQLCLGEKNLPFASQQYRTILDANPSDEVALAMREKIINIATLTYVPPSRERAPQRRRFGITGAIMVVGFLLSISGMVADSLRSMIALGAALIVLGIGIRFYANKD